VSVRKRGKEGGRVIEEREREEEEERVLTH
jgi:hypothetical protein